MLVLVLVRAHTCAGCSVDESFERFKPLVDRAVQEGVKARQDPAPSSSHENQSKFPPENGPTY